MQFAKTVQLQGDSDKYSLSPEVKRYTLIDLGFEETKRGNFEYVGSVDTDNPFKPVAKLRILISADLTGVKMETVTGNGMRKINIFTHPRAKEFVEQYHFILKEMLKRNVFLVTKG
ncbi:DUF1831 domain-containing protein [Limosilactobacillus urinaemulieris]|uniref:DUF1831 domain-containing protein n=1 Tax=Limosilactobacillus urinaemulieris TaxID=2742600 RepID=UPI0028E8257F|nr:DUF1831 domain-containing protein [Limosilactobacillus urinaemulieris]